MVCLCLSFFSLPSSAHSQEGYKIPLACRRMADYGTLGLDSLDHRHIHLSKRNRNLCLPGLHAVKKKLHIAKLCSNVIYTKLKTFMYAISIYYPSHTSLDALSTAYLLGNPTLESSVKSLYAYVSVVSLTHFRHPWKKGHLQISSTSIPSCI